MGAEGGAGTWKALAEPTEAEGTRTCDPAIHPELFTQQRYVLRSPKALFRNVRRCLERLETGPSTRPTAGEWRSVAAPYEAITDSKENRRAGMSSTPTWVSLTDVLLSKRSRGVGCPVSDPIGTKFKHSQVDSRVLGIRKAALLWGGGPEGGTWELLRHTHWILLPNLSDAGVFSCENSQSSPRVVSALFCMSDFL